MQIHRLSIVMLATCLTLGCGSDDDAAPREAPPVEDTVFGDTVQTLDKARAVEDTVLQHKQDLDRAVSESEGN